MSQDAKSRALALTHELVMSGKGGEWSFEGATVVLTVFGQGPHWSSARSVALTRSRMVLRSPNTEPKLEKFDRAKALAWLRGE